MAASNLRWKRSDEFFYSPNKKLILPLNSLLECVDHIKSMNSVLGYYEELVSVSFAMGILKEDGLLPRLEDIENTWSSKKVT